MSEKSKLTFSITIDAAKETVWKALWDDANYRRWTSVFHPGSYAESDWEQGSTILFLSPERDGMYAMIQELVLNERMVFRHIGEVKKGVEQEPKEWAGSLEAYTLKEQNGKTELHTELDAVPEFEGYFREVFPKALQIVKDIAEGK
jgi:uncharacterized protein YndB with AHSA1/START domain